MTATLASRDGRAAVEPTQNLAIGLEPVGDIADLANQWRHLERRSRTSFFQSWGWIGCWLRQLPADVMPLLLRGTSGGLTVALALFVRRAVRRRIALHSLGLFLHRTGTAELDGLTIEQNGLLVDGGVADLEQRCLAWLVEYAQWDELHLSGVDRGRLEAVERLGLAYRVEDRKPAYTILLPHANGAADHWMARLSANTRYQLRRSMRQYEAGGRLAITAAAGVDEAVRMLDALKVLHQRTWQSRGHPGAFSSASFERFHRALIADRFASGEIQLLCITAGERPIGYLYNFLHGGRVYCYQSGFDYSLGGAHKPGMVCHAMAVQWNIEHGAAVYDLLAGASQLKRSLATDCEELLWLVVRRDQLQFRIEEWLRRARATARQIRRH